jgi:hypothetical protein
MRKALLVTLALGAGLVAVAAILYAPNTAPALSAIDAANPQKQQRTEASGADAARLGLQRVFDEYSGASGIVVIG